MKKFKLKHLLIAAGSVLTFSSCTVAVASIANNIKAINNSIKNDEDLVLTFDENGGILSGNKTLNIKKDAKFSTVKDFVPTVSKEGVTGQPGWYITDPSNPVTDETTFSANTTLKANWKLYTVNYDVNGGQWPDGTTQTKQFKDVTIVHADEVPAPYKPNTAFSGWRIEGSNENKPFPHIPSDLSTSTTITLKANYTEKANITIAFTSGEGAFNDSSKTKFVTISNNSKWSDIKSKFASSNFSNPDYNGKTKMFSEWQLNGSSITDDYIFTASSIVKAKYVDSAQITFDANGGKWSDGDTTKNSIKHATSTSPTFATFKEDITTNPTKVVGDKTYNLIGWFKDVNANTKVEDSASLADIPDPVYAYYDEQHEVKLNSSSQHVKSITCDKYIRNDNNKVITITPVTGYKITSATANYDKNKYTNTSVSNLSIDPTTGVGTMTITNAPGEDIDLTVNTTEITYSITISKLDGVATLSTSPASQQEYTKEVTITCTFSEGYVKDYLKVTDSAGNEVTITDNKFNMPASNVTVEAKGAKDKYTVAAAGLTTGVQEIAVPSEKQEYQSEVSVKATTTDTGYKISNMTVVKTGTSDVVSSTFDEANATVTFTMPAYGVTVNATATANSYTLTLNPNGGKSEEQTVSVSYLTDLVTATSGKSAEHKEGAFKGWGKISTDDEIVTSSDTMPHNDYTLYAKWKKYNFNFEASDHSSISGTTSYSNLISLKSDDISIVVSTDNGYTFTKKYDVYDKDGNKKISEFDFSSSLKPGLHDSLKSYDVGSTFTLKPVITADDATVKFINNGGTIKNKGTATTSLTLKTGDNILTKFGNDIIATHGYAKFNHWEMYSTTSPTGATITSDTIMPYDGCDIKPIWDTYNFKVVGDNCKINGGESTTIEKKIELHGEEGFTITPIEGYMFDHYEYKLSDTATYQTATMPFQPYKLDSNITDGTTVYLKAVCVKVNTITLYANGGTFGDTDYKFVNVKSGTTWKDIKDTITKPTKGSATILGWTDGEGNAISDTTEMIDGLIIQPTWSE